MRRNDLFFHLLRRGGKPLTADRASVRIARVKLLLFLPLVLSCVSCSTLENRRDLYRSPAEGYEEWYPNPPPTRGPATGPVRTSTSTTTTTQGVMTFPEEQSGRAESLAKRDEAAFRVTRTAYSS